MRGGSVAALASPAPSGLPHVPLARGVISLGTARRGGSMAKRAQSQLTLRVLGSVSVERDGRRLELPPSKKTRALLGYLLAEPREHTREHLCALFWDVPDDLRGALRWSLSRLRPILDQPARRRLLADRETVRLDSDETLADLRSVEELCARGLVTATRAELAEAAALFRGELLEGLELGEAFRFQAWRTAKREQARRLHAQVLRALVAALVAEPEEALRPARLLVELDPTAEEAHRGVVLLLGRLGRVREARKQYDACREILATTLGEKPSAEMEAALRSLRSLPEAAGAPPAALLVPAPSARAPCVGREAETLALEASLERPGLTMLLGDPGIGKSRLLEELAKRMRARGGEVIVGRSYEAEQARPYGCIVDALRSSGVAQAAGPVLRADLAALLSELAPAPAALDRTRLFDAVVALLRERRRVRPLLVSLDDAQWIDEGSAALLHYLVRSLASEGVALVLAARGGELAENTAALRLVRTLRGERALFDVLLGPLGAPDIAALLQSSGIAADADRVHEQSEGNPLLALELGRALAEGRPPLSGGLAEALEQRLSALDEPAQALLAWSAALGRGCTPTLLASLAGRPPPEVIDAISALERHNLFRLQGDGTVDFAHDLLREAAYRRIPPARRRMLHAALAQALWRSDPDERQRGALAGSVARQALLGGEDALAVRASIEAAEQALRIFANVEALGLAERALPLLPALQREERLRSQLALLRVCLHADRRPARLEKIARELSRLVLEAEASGLQDLVAEGFSELSVAHYFREDEVAALKGSLKSAESARSNPDPLARARGLAQAGRCLAQIEGDMDRASVLLNEAAAAAQSAGIAVTDISLGRGLLHAFRGEDEDARRQLEEAVGRSQERGDHWRETEALFALCRIGLERGEPGEALRAAERVLPVAEKMSEGDEPAVAHCLVALARLAKSAADGEAEALFRGAADELRHNEARWRLAQLLLLRADLEMAAGRLDVARRWVDEVRGLGGDSSIAQMRSGHAHLLLAELSLAAGQRKGAREHLASALTAPGGLTARLRARISSAAARAAGKS